MSNNFEIVIPMLKKSLILIALFFIIVAIPARAESLQELINRNKIEAIAKVKPIVQKMINDSIEVYKQHPLWHDDYKDAENFHYIYKVDLDYNDKAFYFDDSTSVNSIIDTTKILAERMLVLDKRFHELAYIIDDRNGLRFHTFILRDPNKKKEISYQYRYDIEQKLHKQFGSSAAFVNLPTFDGFLQFLVNNKIFIEDDSGNNFIDFDSFFRSEDNHWSYESEFIAIRFAGISKRAKAVSQNVNYKPQVERNFSKSILKIENTLDSLDSIYLQPIIKNKMNNFYSKLFIGKSNTAAIYEMVTGLGITFDEFIRDSAKLSFKSSHRFLYEKSLHEFQAGANILDSLKYNPIESNINYFIYWDDKKIGEYDFGQLYCNFECSYIEDAFSIFINRSNYDWVIGTQFGSIIKSNNQLYVVFSYYYTSKYETSSITPYQQFLEQVIDEYYVRKDYGK